MYECGHSFERDIFPETHVFTSVSCASFNDAVSIEDEIALNGRVINPLKTNRICFI
jgi:hypothetical protein